MQKTTKGALAAGAAAMLLLGSAGTLAFWTDETDIDGGEITSGSIELLDGECGEWVHTADESEVGLIVPGDEVEKECEVTLELTGDNIGATVELDTASLDEAEGELGAELEASATSDPSTVEGAGSYDVDVVISVALPYEDATNESQTDTAVLDGLELTASQTNVLTEDTP